MAIEKEIENILQLLKFLTRMMQSLIEEIKKSINTSVAEFIQNIASKYNLNNDDLIKTIILSEYKLFVEESC